MLKMKLNSTEVIKDGQKLYMDTVPITVAVAGGDRTLVPIRFVAEGLGYNVDWDNDTQEVTIYGRKKYFETVDDCAFDWAMHFNAMSIAVFKEMGAIIYKDNKGYYWDNVIIGKDKEVYWDTSKVHRGIAFIHSHSGGKHSMTKSMSNQDFVCARKMNRPLYMIDSGGQLWVYDPKSDKPSQKFVKEGAPCDARWMDIKENSKLMNEYFLKGYHDLYEFDFGYKADYYNKLFMKGLHYLEERAE